MAVFMCDIGFKEVFVMSDSLKKDYMPILPYDDEANDHFLIYENSEYISSRDRIANMINKNSGNVLKYYNVEVNPEIMRIDSETGKRTKIPMNADTQEKDDELSSRLDSDTDLDDEL